MQTLRLIIASVFAFFLSKFLSFRVSETLNHSDTLEAPLRAGNEWGMILISAVATLVGFFVARAVEQRVAGDDLRPHAFLILFSAGIALSALLTQPWNGSLQIYAGLGTLLACLIEWRITRSNFRPARG